MDYEEAVNIIHTWSGPMRKSHTGQDTFALEFIEAADFLASPAAVGSMSDGYHTFDDLYEQRLILSAALAKNNPCAWKSKLHEYGTELFGGGWFIVGFDTPEGSYTYHYELKDWGIFECKELPVGKHWDGHTSKDVRRLLSMVSIKDEWVFNLKKVEGG